MATGAQLLDDATAAEAEPLEFQGRDEMNLAEFPIAALTDYLPKGLNTISFSDGTGSLLITGSDAYGLPTAADADVIVALIQLTKRRNNFHEPSVTFNRAEVLGILGWPESGKSYRRLAESLFRWSTTSLRYEGTWWDNRSRRKMNAVFHILNEVVLFDRAEGGGGGGQPGSYFTWNKIFLDSCQAGNLKRMDLRKYFSLEHASSKRLYRFLDKRLHRQAEQAFDLAEIAFERVGLSRGYVGKKGGVNVGKVREKLQPAIDELEALGFLAPFSREERYVKEGEGWAIRFRRAAGGSPDAAEGPPPRDADADAVAASDAPAAVPAVPAAAGGETASVLEGLVRRGVTPAKAAELARLHPAGVIAEKVEIFDWRLGKGVKGMEKNPAGWLVKAVEDGYPVPRGFESRAGREARLKAEAERERSGAEVARSKREEGRRRDRELQAVDDHLAALTPARLAALEAEAVAAAGEEARRNLEAPAMARFRKALLLKIVREHVAETLRQRKLGPTLF